MQLAVTPPMSTFNKWNPRVRHWGHGPSRGCRSWGGEESALIYVVVKKEVNPKTKLSWGISQLIYVATLSFGSSYTSGRHEFPLQDVWVGSSIFKAGLGVKLLLLLIHRSQMSWFGPCSWEWEAWWNLPGEVFQAHPTYYPDNAHLANTGFLMSLKNCPVFCAYSYSSLWQL